MTTSSLPSEIGIATGCDGCESVRAAVLRFHAGARPAIVDRPHLARMIRTVGNWPDSPVELCPVCERWWEEDADDPLQKYAAWKASLLVPFAIAVDNAACADCVWAAEEQAATRGSSLPPTLIDRRRPILSSDFGGDLVCERHEVVRINHPEYDERFWDEDTLENRQAMDAHKAAVRARYRAV